MATSGLATVEATGEPMDNRHIKLKSQATFLHASVWVRTKAVVRDVDKSVEMTSCF